MPTYALVDCNNFYVSCERLFRPDGLEQVGQGYFFFFEILLRSTLNRVHEGCGEQRAEQNSFPEGGIHWGPFGPSVEKCSKKASSSAGSQRSNDRKHRVVLMREEANREHICVLPLTEN